MIGALEPGAAAQREPNEEFYDDKTSGRDMAFLKALPKLKKTKGELLVKTDLRHVSDVVGHGLFADQVIQL